MGVYGLWRLLDATGKPVPLETLEGKVLAIDVSIWIHQVLQGYQDRHGNPKPNAHLLGLFNRICKLLYYKIKPVFVFDGGVPMLKKNTIASRRKQKSIAASKAQKMKTDLINNLIKHTAVKTALNTDTTNGNSDLSELPANMRNKRPLNDIFKLPDMPSTSQTELLSSDEYDSDSSMQLSPRKQAKWIGNIHNVDVSSAEFRALPADVRYDILTDLKETRKQNSWGRLHEMPEETHEFSGYQMRRLLKRRLVQESLESAEKEMGGKTLTLEELDKLLTEQGISTKGRDAAYRIAADSTTRVLYISDKNALTKSNLSNINSENEDVSNDTIESNEPVAGPSNDVHILEDINEYEIDDDWDSDSGLAGTNDFEVEMESTIGYDEDSDVEFVTEMNESRPLAKKYFGKNVMNPALTYMLEYSGLSQAQILALLEHDKKEINKSSEKNFKSLQKKILKDKEDNEFERVKSSNDAESISVVDQKALKGDSEQELIESNLKATGDVTLVEITKPDIISEVTDNNTVSDSEQIEERLISPKPTPAIKMTESTTISTTDSDSDDFIEIPDVPIPYTNSINQNTSKDGIQITFKSDEKIEDDIFADVFQPKNNQSTLTLTNQNVKQPDKSVEKSYQDIIREKPGEEQSIKQLDDSINKVCQGTNIIREKPGEEEIVKKPLTKVQENDSENYVERNDIDKQLSDSEPLNTEVTVVRDETELDTVIDSPRRLSPLPTNEAELLSLKGQLEDAQKELAANIGRLERQATDVSDQIRIEAQELLKLFGIPYIVAPMEAEAQCAYLEQIHLTDGTITDDSDIWLFGGQCVYKNFFNNNKRVLQYRSCDIQHHFKLTRNEMIQLALLVGSDYTTGLSGIGPVTGLEILAAFPAEGDNLLRGLINFCSWIKAGRSTGPGRTTLRNKLKNVKIEKGFPSQAVVQAYLFPKVDESKDTFTWGKPNMVLLSDYARMKFGWDKTKYDAIMKPVLKRLQETTSQKTMDLYFKLQSVPKSIENNLSKRVQKAVQRLNYEDTGESVNAEDKEEEVKEKKAKVTTGKQRKRKEPKKVTDIVESSDKPPSSDIPVNSNTPPSSDIPVNSNKPPSSDIPVSSDKYVEEFIPQREKDRAESLKKKLHAIEVLRKSKKGLNNTKKVKRCVRKVTKEAKLSESDSSSS